MNLRKSIDYEIGFADSKIISCHSARDKLVVVLKCWNEKILKIEFSECILFYFLNSPSISDVCETQDSPLFNDALKKVYEKIPKEQPYKLYEFLDQDDDPVIQVGALNIRIYPLNENLTDC